MTFFRTRQTKNKNPLTSYSTVFVNRMVFLQIMVVVHSLLNAIGLSGNLLVIATVVLEKKLHVMRYIYLASLAVSDALCLILVNSPRITSTAIERWPFGETLCYLNPFFGRCLYLNTLLHLIAVSYERYKAIVKSPLTYNGKITKCRVLSLVLIWLIPVPFSVGPLLGWGELLYTYNPEVFVCEHRWSVNNTTSKIFISIFAVTSFLSPFLVIFFLNRSVLKTVNNLHANAIAAVQLGCFSDSESQPRNAARRFNERKAAVDVTIIISAFLVCYVPYWFAGLYRLHIESSKFPAEAIIVVNCIFLANTGCNPIIYSIRKRDFRAGVKNIWGRICEMCRACLNDIRETEVITDNFRSLFIFRGEVFTVRTTTAPALEQRNKELQNNGGVKQFAVRLYRSDLSSIEEVPEP